MASNTTLDQHTRSGTTRLIECLRPTLHHQFKYLNIARHTETSFHILSDSFVACAEMAVFLARDVSVYTRGAVLVVISIVINGVAFGLVALRLGARLASKRKLGMDDYAILLSLVRFADICMDCQPLDDLADGL